MKRSDTRLLCADERVLQAKQRCYESSASWSLKAFRVGAFTALGGRAFHELGTRLVKKCNLSSHPWTSWIERRRL